MNPSDFRIGLRITYDYRRTNSDFEDAIIRSVGTGKVVAVLPADGVRHDTVMIELDGRKLISGRLEEMARRCEVIN